MLDALLPFLSSLAKDLESTPAGAQVQSDIASLKGLAAQHAQALEGDVLKWAKARWYEIAG